MALRNNTWKLNQWYDQDVAGNADYTTYAATAWVWGRASTGELGQNSTTAYVLSPIQVPGTWSKLSVGGGNHMLGTKPDGTLWAWGGNTQGELGQNNKTNRSSPVQIGSGTDWSDVTASYYYSAAMKTDGTLWTWGINNEGQLGQNTPDNSHRSSPVQVPGTNWSLFVCQGAECNFAVKTDGTLWGWGKNEHGIGNNTTTRYSSPTQIPGTTWSTDINKWRNGTGFHMPALTVKTDGTLWSWGYNLYGPLGQNNTTHYSSPVQVGSSSDWNSAGGGGLTSVASKTDGTLWSWGDGFQGQLGQNDRGSIPRKSSPAQIPGTTWNIVGSDGSFVYSCIKTNGELWTWGKNGGGQVGDGSQSKRSSPVQVPGTDWGTKLRGGDTVCITKPL